MIDLALQNIRLIDFQKTFGKKIFNTYDMNIYCIW